MDQHILADIDINGIRTGTTTLGIHWCHILSRCKDEATQIAHILTAIEMVRPERRVDDLHILHGHILTVRDVHVTRTHRLHIRTLRIILTTDPELLPVLLSVAVDGTRTRDGETVHTVGIHQCSKVVERLSLHTGLHDLEVTDAVRALQLSPLLYQQVGLGFEEERTAEEGATRNDDHTATLLGATVDHGLQFFGLDTISPTVYTIIRHNVALQSGKVYTRGVREPCRNLRTIGPQFHVSCLFLAHSCRANSKNHSQ